MEKKVIRILVASPSDTKSERESCVRVFEELNQGIGEKHGFVIEKRMWEYNTRPSIGEYSQAVVSEQLGNDYDVFVGIMNNKFGTETKKAGSGTEEEFNNAYNRIENKDKVEIMFYFNDEPVKKSEINTEELNKINAFKKKVSDLGGYHWTYNGAQEFEKVFSMGQIPKDIPVYKCTDDVVDVIEVICSAGLASSKREARRLLEQNSITIEGVVLHKSVIKVPPQGIIVKIGKRRFLRISTTF